VSNSSRARKLFSACWPIATIAGVLTLSAVTSATAADDYIRIDSCFGGWHSSQCITRWAPTGDANIRTVPEPKTEEEKAHAVERDHRWLQRCRPIVAQDRYGVPRYRYAAAGCDLGVIE
jgi:hypothetical protein